MATAPLVSVCIPTFDHAHFLPEALASAQAQTYPHLEIVVTDNCSTDATAGIIAAAMQRDPRIRHVRHPANLGMARNFTSCITEARGEYVKLLCDDDRLAPDCVSQLVDLMTTRPGVAIAGCARQFTDLQWRPVRVLGAAREQITVVPGETMRVECFVWGNRIGEPTAVLFRRADALRGFSEEYSQLVDLEMWCHLLLGGAFAYTPAVLCSVRLHDNQTTAANLRSGRVVEDKRRLFRDLVPGLRPSLGLVNQLMWDARFALSAVRVREAGGASTIADAAGAVFHPWLYAAIVARGVALGMRLRSLLRSG